MLKKVDLHKAGDTKLSHTYTYKKRSSTSSYISGLVENESIRYGGTTALRSYAHDALGRVTNITDAKFGIHRYTYDYRGFIKTADEESFSYDKNGNITKNGSVTLEYKDADGIKDRLTSVGGQKVYYECAESLNPTMWNGRSYDYEGRRLRRFGYNGTSADYTYDDQCHRIKKVVGGKTTNYYYSGDLLVCEDGPNGRLDFLYDENGQLYGFIKDNSSKYFYIKDILGTILGIVDENSLIVAKYSYKAFGECTITQNTNNIATINPFRFKCYYYDNESGMYYCQTRYYVPEWGRWLNADNVNYLKFDNINGMNLFAYCANNPVMGYDPQGTFVSTILGAVFGAVWGGISSALQGKDIGKGMLVGAATGALAGFFVDAAVATGGVGGILVATAGGFIAGFAGDIANQIIVDGRTWDEVNPDQALTVGVVTAITNVLGLGISYATSGLGEALPQGLNLLQQLTASLSPAITPLGSWIGQAVLGFGIASFSSLLGFVK